MRPIQPSTSDHSCHTPAQSVHALATEAFKPFPSRLTHGRYSTKTNDLARSIRWVFNNEGHVRVRALKNKAAE